jgi:hypothetical protein
MEGKPEPNPAPERGYGFGWVRARLRGATVIGHEGGLDGFISDLERFPDQNLTVAVLVNCSPPPPELNPPDITRGIAQFLLWKEMRPVPAHRVAKVDPEALDALAGRYELGGMRLTITPRGDRLVAGLTGQSPLEFLPASETEFFTRVIDAQMAFEKNERGETTAVTLTQSGRKLRGTRVKEEATAKVDPALYDSYAGEYDYGAAGTLTVTREGDRLFAQMTGQPKLEIYPSSETEFFWKAVDARITFVKDEAGKVVKAVHRQGGGTIEARKTK